MASTAPAAPAPAAAAPPAGPASITALAEKEFRSVVIGGAILAANAGFVNAVMLSGPNHVAVSHMTGHITKMAGSIGTGQIMEALWFAAIISSFVFGSSVSGYVTGDNKFRLGRGYGGLLLLESICLFALFLLLKYEIGWASVFTAAFAMGLQNAMATSYSGAVLRTTHCTGMSTDVGVLLGQIVRRNPRVERWRLKVFLPLLLGYALGAMSGSLASAVLAPYLSVLLTTAVTGLAAVFYLSWGAVKVAADFFQKAIDGLNLIPSGEDEDWGKGKSSSALELQRRKGRGGGGGAGGNVVDEIAAPIIEKYLATPANVEDIDANIRLMMSEMEQTLKAALHAQAGHPSEVIVSSAPHNVNESTTSNHSGRPRSAASQTSIPMQGRNSTPSNGMNQSPRQQYHPTLPNNLEDEGEVALTGTDTSSIERLV